MPNLINNDTNPDPKLVNYYLNYVTPIVQGEPLTWSNTGFDISALLTAAWGNVRTAWTKQAAANRYWALRFPGISESLSGNITAPTSGSSVSAGARVVFGYSTGGSFGALNSTNANNDIIDKSVNTAHCNISSSLVYLFGVVNQYALMLCGFSSTDRTSNSWFYNGWVRNPAFTDTAFPRNLVALNGSTTTISGASRVNTENLTTTQALYRTQDLGGAGIFNPAISCSVSTPGADTIEIFLRDNASPYNYIGQPYFLIQGPSSLTVGKIYKNNSMTNGRDWEESDNPYWMCICKPTGGRTLLMRVWTEGIT